MMGLTSPVSCVSDALSYYRVYFYLIYWNCYHSTNYISLMMSLAMMGLDRGSPDTCAFPFCSGNSVGHVSGIVSGVFVPTVIESIVEIVLLAVFFFKEESSPKLVDS